MSGPDPFRSELDAAHHRIETLEAEHAAKVAVLERENERLRQRLIDVGPKQSATGRTFGALGMIILGVSLAGGIVFARMTRSVSVGLPVTPPIEMAPLELEAEPTEAANAGDFDRGAAAAVLNHVHIEDCVKAGDPSASGHVKLTIASSGLVSTAVIDDGAYRGTAVGRCIEERFRSARVQPFTGGPRLVGKSFVIR